MVEQRGIGEHGPPDWRQKLLLDLARRSGVVPDEFSEEDWREELRQLVNQKASDRWNARSRRFWWVPDAYFEYLWALKGERLEGLIEIPPEIDPELLWSLSGLFRERPIPPKVPKFDAEEVAGWAYRHRRQKMSYPDLARELALKRSHQIGGFTRRLRNERLIGCDRGAIVEVRQRLIDRKPPSARSIRRQVDENAHIWELAEAELAR